MTDHVPTMIIAVLATVTVMLLAADPLTRFIQANPTVVVLGLGFLLMIRMALIADGSGGTCPGTISTLLWRSQFSLRPWTCFHGGLKGAGRVSCLSGHAACVPEP